MPKENILRTKSFLFAVRITRLSSYLKRKHGEYVISQQLMRSGTAVCALLREAEFAESRRDFGHKLKIGLKEANESVYWIELLFVSGYISQKMFESIYSDAAELIKLLIASIKTIMSKL